MNVIEKYLSVHILKLFFIITTTVIGIYLAVDFFEKIDNFLEKKVDIENIIAFFFFKIPFIIAKITPLGILLSVIVIFSLMNKNNELLALKSSGISVFYILKPILFLSASFYIALFLFSEIIAPSATQKANKIWFSKVKNKSMITTKDKNIWLKGSRFITHIGHYDHGLKKIFGVSINFFDKNFNLIKKIDAKEGVFKNGNWTLYDVMEQNLNSPNSIESSVKLYKEKTEKIELLPEEIIKTIKIPDEMSILELFKYIKKIEEEGYNARTYTVDLHAKIAFPLVCIILSLAGVGISIKKRKHDNISFNVAAGVGIAFLYWVFQSFCLSLGYGGMLPIIIAVWTPNIVFICAAIVMLLDADT